MFEYRIEAVPTAAYYPFSRYEEEKIDLDAIKGTAITLTFRGIYGTTYNASTDRDRTGNRQISGVVASAGILGTEGNTVVYEFVLRPRWWFATIGKQSRLFTGERHGDVVDVLRLVLQHYGRDIDLRIDRSTVARRDLLRQAQETDWAFCMRLCEEFGYMVWFEHRDGTDILVIADGIGRCAKQDRPFDTLAYHPDGGNVDQQYITQLSFRSAVTLDKVTVHDHHYLLPCLAPGSASYRAWYEGPLDPDECYCMTTPFESYEAAEYAQSIRTAGDRGTNSPRSGRRGIWLASSSRPRAACAFARRRGGRCAASKPAARLP